MSYALSKLQQPRTLSEGQMPSAGSGAGNKSAPYLIALPSCNARLSKPWLRWALLASSEVICPSGSFLTGLSSLISGFPKNISVPTHPKSDLELFASHPTGGAYHDRHGRGEGCGGRGSVGRET